MEPRRIRRIHSLGPSLRRLTLRRLALRRLMLIATHATEHRRDMI